MIAIDNVGERRATRAMEKALRNWLVSTSRQVLQDLLHNNVISPKSRDKKRKGHDNGASKTGKKSQKQALRLAEDLSYFLREKELFEG